MATYAEELRKQAQVFLEDHPQLSYEWKNANSLSFPRKAPSGFGIEITASADDRANSDSLALFTDEGIHHFFEGPPSEAVTDALTWARMLLSSICRIRARRAGGSPFRWILESHDGEQWRLVSSTTLIWWNWFGQRSETIYQNDLLPPPSAAA